MAAGKNAGGDGCVRDIAVSVLSERRTVRPFRLASEEIGQAGENIWARKDDYEITYLSNE